MPLQLSEKVRALAARAQSDLGEQFARIDELYTGLEGVNTAEPTDEPYYVTMPSLIGKTALQAHDELKQLGLTMIADPADPFGYVI